MIVHQMDAVTAFLNGVLDEEIYMEQPPGYIKLGEEQLVCKLKRSLYGLKQSSRCWNTVFTDHMESAKFKQCTADPCLFVQSEGANLAIITVSVDDLIIVTKAQEVMRKIKNNLSRQFKMKVLGKISYCLGITIEYDEQKSCLWMHQTQYLHTLLERYGLSKAKPSTTPTDVSVKLIKDDGVSKLIGQVSYQSMVGSLLYATTATRPDIAYAVGAVSKFNYCPTEAHLTAVKRILRYFKGIINLGLLYIIRGPQTAACMVTLMLIGLEMLTVATPQQATFL